MPLLALVRKRQRRLPDLDDHGRAARIAELGQELGLPVPEAPVVFEGLAGLLADEREDVVVAQLRDAIDRDEVDAGLVSPSRSRIFRHAATTRVFSASVPQPAHMKADELRASSSLGFDRAAASTAWMDCSLSHSKPACALPEIASAMATTTSLITRGLRDRGRFSRRARRILRVRLC